MTAMEDAQTRLRDCQRQHNQLQALHTISEAVNRSLDLDALLEVALAQVLEVLELDAGDVRLIQDGQLVLRAAHGLSSGFVAAEASIPLGFCQCGQAAQTGEVLVVEDLLGRHELANMLCRYEQSRAVLGVPIRTTERVVGLLHVVGRAPRTFDEADRNLLKAIGEQIGIAIERAQLYEELKVLNATLETRVAERTRELEAAREALAQKAEALREMRIEERRIEEKTRSRIARDLHDGVQQLIVASLFEIQAIRDLLTTRPDLAADKLADVQGLLRRIETEMRRAIFNLRPVTLDAHGLVPALRDLAAEFARASGVSCALRLTGTPCRFAADAEIAAFRIVQEALNNLGKHAGAHYAEIGVTFGSRQVIVEVRDDGIGFEPAAVEQEPRSHLGLIGMHERAESVGGTLTIWSRPGEGTRIILQLPLQEAVVYESDSRLAGG